MNKVIRSLETFATHFARIFGFREEKNAVATHLAPDDWRHFTSKMRFKVLCFTEKSEIPIGLNSIKFKNF